MRKLSNIRTQEKNRTLQWSMLVTLLGGWFAPLLALSVIIFAVVSVKMNGQQREAVVLAADKAIEICQMRIEDAVLSSRNSSYLPTLKDASDLLQTSGSRGVFKQSVDLFLEQHYRYNDSFLATMFYLYREPETVYFTYNEAAGGSYGNVRIFKEQSGDEVRKIAETIDTDVVFVNEGGRIYMVRNLMDKSYRPFAALIMEIDMDQVLESLQSIIGYEDAEIFVDGEPLLNKSREFAPFSEAGLTDRSVYAPGRGDAYVYKQVIGGRHRIIYVVYLNEKDMINEMLTVRVIFVVFVLFMIPLIALVLRFFHRKVTGPVYELVKGSQEIEKGHYGYQISQMGDSREFSYLDDAFNHMSGQLQYQFEKIYLEELALKDAKIMALQSQINPHFLNNTLEIINWEARMGGNFKVSGMIEALSTMLSATMNRKSQAMIPLSEELSYVDAYLYIIGQRFGERLEIKKEIDESLLRVKIPRLIIQPIVENAVEHGVDTSEKGLISLKVYADGDKMYIEVMDNGVLSQTERKKIDMLLSEDYESREEKSVSLGIRNVNQRLKIIYGKECSLTIAGNEQNHTVSTLIVKISEDVNNIRQ